MKLRRLFTPKPQVIVGDARYDGWPVVRDFEDVETARANRDHLRSVSGIAAVLTSDYELDKFGRGDIALRVPPDDYGEAETVVSGYED